MKVTVEKKSRKGTSFVSEDRWYNFKRGNKEAELPTNVAEGCEIELTEYDDSGKSVYFTKYKVVSKSDNKNKAGKGDSKGYQKSSSGNGYQKDPSTQRSIVVQSMVKAAVEACEKGSTSKTILAMAEDLISYHDTKVAEGTKPSKEEAKEAKPPVKKKTKAEMAEDPEPEEDGSGEDPDFDLD